MLKILCLLLGITHASIFDNKIITSIRHALEKNLDYIEKNFDRVSADCLFGVVLTRGKRKGKNILDVTALFLCTYDNY